MKHQVDGSGEVTLASYAYDNLGRLQSKSLHGSAANKQSYTYNVRSWLTGISGTKFTQNLYYNTGTGAVKYNGSISSMTWQAGDESTVRGYKFTYDGIDRMLTATYGETAGINTNTNRFSENVTAYDKNGNRLVFSQDGNQRALTSGNWTYYKYDGLNRLTEQGTCTNKVTTSGTNVLVQHFYDS
ncbi:RHS repeat-associated core domain-containing protein, partial [Bacteroides uniformis]